MYVRTLQMSTPLALLLLLLATRDAHARQGGGDKDDRKHDIAILKGDDEGFLGQILAQHRLYFGVQEFPQVSAALAVSTLTSPGPAPRPLSRWRDAQRQ